MLSVLFAASIGNLAQVERGDGWLDLNEPLPHKLVLNVSACDVPEMVHLLEISSVTVSGGAMIDRCHSGVPSKQRVGLDLLASELAH